MTNKLLPFVLIFCLFKSVRAFNNYSAFDSYSVYEDTNNLSFFGKGFTYPNGTGLMQSYHLYDNDSLENNLYIRLLHPNGTLTKFTVPTTYNSTNYQPDAFPLNDGYMLITQENDDHILHGMLVDWSGHVLQR